MGGGVRHLLDRAAERHPSWDRRRATAHCLACDERWPITVLGRQRCACGRSSAVVAGGVVELHGPVRAVGGEVPVRRRRVPPLL